MKTSTNNLIITLAIVASTLTASNVLAKGGNNGGNHSFSSHMTSGNNGTGNISNKFKISSQSTSTSSFKTGKVNSNLLNGITTTNPIKTGSTGTSLNHLSQDKLKVSGLNTLKSNGKLSSTNTLTKSSSKKDCKHDCSKWWCGDHCFPWYFGCYSNYRCYDYCYPSYCYSSYYPTYTCDYATPLVVAAPVQPARMRVILGSVIMLNGQSFGAQAGGVRLRFNGIALPIQVVEWTPNGVKAQIPQIELPNVTPADIEVVRLDGSLASKTPVDLTAPQFAINR